MNIIKKENFLKTLRVTSQLLSLSLFFSFIVTIIYIFELAFSALNLVENSQAKIAYLISDRVGNELKYRVAIFLFLFVIFVNSITGMVFYFAGQKHYGRRLLFFGGFISAQVFLLKGETSNTAKNKKTPNMENVCKNKMWPYLLVFLSSPILLFLGTYIKPLDKVNDAFVPIQFSTNTDNPNVIEIFVDGFDSDNFIKYTSDEQKYDLRDFELFTKVVAPGELTEPSVHAMLGGEEQLYWVPGTSRQSMHSLINKKLVSLDTSEVIYTQNVIGTGLREWSDYPGYHSSWSSQPEYMNNLYPEWNILNWSTARDGIIDSKNGISHFHTPDSMMYEFFASSSFSLDNSSPSYTYFAEHTLHQPLMATPEGGITFGASDESSSYKMLANKIIGIVDALKNMTDSNGQNAFDNTNIYLYGDHGNHFKTGATIGQDDTTIVNRVQTAFMVKYADNVLKNNSDSIYVNDEREIWLPHLTEIIDEVNKDPLEGRNFIMDNINFDPGRIFASEVNGDTLMFTMFYGDNLFHKIPGKTTGWYAKDSLEARELISEVVWV